MIGCGLGAMLLGAPGIAGAEANDLPIAWQARPLTLPPVTLRLDGDFVWESLGDGRRGVDGTSIPGATDASYLMLGFGIGVTDQLELGAAARRPATLGGAVPLQLTPDVRYRGPSLYGILRLLDADLEVAVRLDAWIPVGDDVFHTMLGVPFRVHVADRVRVDGGVFLDTDFESVGTGIAPLEVAVMVGPEVWAFGASGVLFAGPEVPLEVGLGMTFPGRVGPVFDSRLSVRFPDLVEGVDAWQIWIRLSVFLTVHDPTPEPAPAPETREEAPASQTGRRLQSSS